jgi:hypothetical protein
MTLLRHLRAAIGTTSWLWHTIPSWSAIPCKTCCHWAVSPPGPCWAASLPHPEEDSLCICHQDKGLRGEASPPYVWQEDTEQCPHLGPGARGCKGNSKATSKAVSGKSWSLLGTMITKDWGQQNWLTCMLAVGKGGGPCRRVCQQGSPQEGWLGECQLGPKKWVGDSTKKVLGHYSHPLATHLVHQQGRMMIA